MSYDTAEWNGRRSVTGDGNGVIYFDAHPEENFREDDNSYWEARGGRRGESYASAYANMLAQMSREERAVFDALLAIYQASGPSRVNRNALLAKLNKEGFSYEGEMEISWLMNVLASVSNKATLVVLYDHELVSGSVLGIEVHTKDNWNDATDFFIFDETNAPVYVDDGSFFCPRQKRSRAVP